MRVPTLAAREAEARGVLIRLLESTRQIERIAARSRAAANDQAYDEVREHVRGLEAATARLRSDLRDWDTGVSPAWGAGLQARLDKLEFDIAGVHQLELRKLWEPPRAVARSRSVSRPRHTEAGDIESRVYSHLYPLTGAVVRMRLSSAESRA